MARASPHAFYGTSLISDEVEDRTITYLFTRPVPRGAIIIGKYLAYLACTALVVLPSVTAVYLLITPVSGGSIGGTFPAVADRSRPSCRRLAVYGAVFALIGALVPRPLVAGLLLIFGWEQVALLVPGYLRRFTVAHYLQSLVPHAMPQDDTVAAIQSLFSEPPTALASLISLAVILVVGPVAGGPDRRTAGICPGSVGARGERGSRRVRGDRSVGRELARAVPSKLISHP